MNCGEMIANFLYNWQTLITGGLALGAAYYAGRPVYRQLALMRAQNNVMVRETIGHMILQLDAYRDRVHDIMSKRLVEVHTAVHHFTEYGQTNNIDEWANQTQTEFWHAHSELKALFVQSRDVEAIEGRKAALLASIELFTGICWDIYRPEYATWHPEECNWTDEEWETFNARSNEAKKEIDDAASAVSVAVRLLNEAYAEQRVGLVQRLRIIDDSLLG